MWIPALELYFNDKQVLMSTRWVNDNIVSVAQQLLKQQCQGKVFGWASPQCSRRSVPDKFPPVPEHSLFVQILNIGGCHWLTTTNIDTNIKYASSGANTVRIYDSGMSLNIPLSTQLDICQFWKPSADRVCFDIMNVEKQPNSFDCGIYALAFATELVFGQDPALCEFKAEEMRSHLIQCFEKQKIECFPRRGTRTIRLGKRVRKSVSVDIFCSCRLPNNPSLPMVLCNRCRRWFHMDCEVKSTTPPKGSKFTCIQCQESLSL